MSNMLHTIQQWHPEDNWFWERIGKKIAKRNLKISIVCLLLSFCVWMLFSIVTIHLNSIGFNFSATQLFLLTAIPSISGAILRVPYSFVIPIFGGRCWTAFSTFILIIPCLWLGYAIENTNTSYIEFLIIALLCGLGGANYASSMANISFFFPKSRLGTALGLNGGLGSLGVSVIQLVASLIIFFPMFDEKWVLLVNGRKIWLQNAALIWVPLLIISSAIALWKMSDLPVVRASFKQQLIVVKDIKMWVLSLLYLGTFGSFIGFSAGFAMLSKIQFPEIDITIYAFWGPLIAVLAQPLGGIISDKFNGTRITMIIYLLMILLVGLVLSSLPGVVTNKGSFISFYITFLAMFFIAGFGSGSTFQIIATLYRQHVKNSLIKKGVNQTIANKNAIIETAAALGFISAIGAIGGFFIPQIFSVSLLLFNSVNYALVVFMIFYLICTLVTKLIICNRI